LRCNKTVISKKSSERLILSSDKTATDDMIIKSRLPCDFCFQGHAVMKAILFFHPRDSHDSRFLLLFFLVTSFLVLSGCSYVPDAVNPVEWYKDTTGLFGDDEEVEVSETGPDADANALKTLRASDVIPGANKDYPKLSSVPDAPTKEERQKITEGGLAADIVDRHYSDEVVPPAPAAVVPPPVPPTASGILSTPPPMPELGRPPVGAPRESVTSASVKNAPKTVKDALKTPPQLSPPSSSEGMSGDEVKVKNIPNSPKKFNARRTTISSKVGLIQFGSGSAELSSADRRKLKRIADSQKKDGGTLRVIGFSSSSTGNMDQLKHQLLNFNISMRRANSVAAVLMEYGVTSKSLYVEAQSDSKPIYLEVMPAGEAGNRRTEIYLEH
jgi:outer membrane protein OmpA-like peptidoglycan-associated protein